MLEKIRELLKDKNLLDKMAGTDDQTDAARLVVDAGAAKGYTLTLDAVVAALAKLFAPQAGELSEEDLKSVSGGMMGADTGTAYGIGCRTKYMCGTNLCTKYKGTNC